LRQVETARGAREVELLRDSHEGAEMAQLHAHNGEW
jgi:hypothetical protein